MLNRTFSQEGKWLTSCAAQVFRTLGFKLDLSVSNISPLYTLSLLPPAQYWRLKILRRRFILHNSSQLLCCLGNQINLLLPQTEYILSDVFFHDDLSPSDFSKSFCALSIHLDLFCIIISIALLSGKPNRFIASSIWVHSLW